MTDPSVSDRGVDGAPSSIPIPPAPPSRDPEE